MSFTAREKGERLLVNGRVAPPEPARVFTVDGDHGRYVVVVSAHVELCTCLAFSQYGNRCSHIEACDRWEASSDAARVSYERTRREVLARDAKMVAEIARGMP